MGYYMHLVCKETKKRCEFYKSSGGAVKTEGMKRSEVMDRIEEPIALIRFLNDHSGKIIKVVGDDVVGTEDEDTLDFEPYSDEWGMS